MSDSSLIVTKSFKDQVASYHHTVEFDDTAHSKAILLTCKRDRYTVLLFLMNIICTLIMENKFLFYEHTVFLN